MFLRHCRTEVKRWTEKVEEGVDAAYRGRPCLQPCHIVKTFIVTEQVL